MDYHTTSNNILLDSVNPEFFDGWNGDKKYFLPFKKKVDLYFKLGNLRFQFLIILLLFIK